MKRMWSKDELGGKIDSYERAKIISGIENPIVVNFYGTIAITFKSGDSYYIQMTAHKEFFQLIADANYGIDEIITSLVDENPDYVFHFVKDFMYDTIVGTADFYEGEPRISFPTIVNKGFFNLPLSLSTKQSLIDGTVKNYANECYISIENISNNYIESNIEGSMKKYSVKEFYDLVSEAL